MNEPFLTAQEVATRLGMSPRWVLEQWEKGRLPGRRLGPRPPARVRFLWSEVEAAIASWNAPPAPAGAEVVTELSGRVRRHGRERESTTKEG